MYSMTCLWPRRFAIHIASAPRTCSRRLLIMELKPPAQTRGDISHFSTRTLSRLR